MNRQRRTCLRSLPAMAALLAGCRPDAFGRAQEKDPEAALRHKFRGIRGGERRIDAFRKEGGVALYLESGLVLDAGVFNRGAKISGYGGHSKGDELVVPKTLRMVRYSEGYRMLGGIREPIYDGTPILDVTVPVAERIPDEVLDRIRKYKGSLILKFRIHPKTLMVAWEVRNGRGYPFKRDEWGNAYTTDEDDMVGGDFCERRVQNRIIDGRSVLVESKGWYIDPETGQRIEADF